MQIELTSTVRELPLVAAQKPLANGLDHAAKNDMRLAISVVGRAGNLLAFARMDGASIVTVDVAVGKARAAAFIKAPSKMFEDVINFGAPSIVTVPGLLPLQGGMPIVYDGEVIGVSGSSADTGQAAVALIADCSTQF